MTFVWSEEAVERLKALHAQGLSGSELASRFGGGLTRGAIFGKLHRLGLTGAKRESGRRQSALAVPVQAVCGLDDCAHHGRAAPGKGPMKFNFARRGPNDRLTPEARDLRWSRSDCLLPPHSLRIGIVDIGDGQCRFIDGDDGLACGHPVAPRSSWCPAHHAIVFIEEAA